MTETKKAKGGNQIIRLALILFLVSAITSGVLGFVNALTKDTIEAVSYTHLGPGYRHQRRARQRAGTRDSLRYGGCRGAQEAYAGRHGHVRGDR